jgi:hypothetical protein
MENLLTRFYTKFSEHVYRTEDTLFQVLYDKVYRPKIYQLKTGNNPSSEQYAQLKLEYI